MAILKNSMDRASDIYNARQEGKAEGYGQANLEIARKMKKAGRPFEEIAEFTGLPAETIDML
jgi:predicted transposase/invertase (TIGR01784 family)